MRRLGPFSLPWWLVVTCCGDMWWLWREVWVRCGGGVAVVGGGDGEGVTQWWRVVTGGDGWLWRVGDDMAIVGDGDKGSGGDKGGHGGDKVVDVVSTE